MIRTRRGDRDRYRGGHRSRERTYLGLLAAGTVLPYAHVLPWLAAHGPDLPRLAREASATSVGRFFSWDVLAASSTLLVVAAADDELTPTDRLLVGLGALGGASVGLPLYLWLRERNRNPGRAARRQPA